jgi:arginyl-tRNA synthetase
MMFNPEESIELNGNTGPFIQYAHARIKSLLTKSGSAANSTVSASVLQEVEKDIIKLLVEEKAILLRLMLILIKLILFWDGKHSQL